MPTLTSPRIRDPTIFEARGNPTRHSPGRGIAAPRLRYGSSHSAGRTFSTFMHDGECFVIGRRKDVIIIAGNNVFPEDVEDAVGRIPGVIPGRVAAFGVEDDEIGTEVLCVLAETEATDAEKKVLRKAVKAAGIDIDVTISRVYLVPPRWLIKSSSGKPARAANKARAITDLSWR